MSIVAQNIFCCSSTITYNSVLPNVKNLGDIHRANLQDELSYTEVIDILDQNDLSPKITYSSYSTQCQNTDTSLAKAVSESIFDSAKHSEYIIVKCLKYLKDVITQKKTDLPLRIQKFLTNEELIDDFQVYPTKLEYINFLADLISLTFNIKLQIYEIKNGSSLEAKMFANKNDRVVHVLRILKTVFVSLKDSNEVDSKVEICESTTDENDAVTVSIGDLLEVQSDDESVDFQLQPINLFLKKSTDSDDSMISDISLCEASDNKSENSLEVICTNKKSSNEESRYETTLSLSEAKSEVVVVNNLFSYSEKDHELDAIFAVALESFSIDQNLNSEAACKEIFSQLNESHTTPDQSYLRNNAQNYYNAEA